MNTRKLITTGLVAAFLAVSVQDLFSLRFAMAQPEECTGRVMHCIDIEECTDAGGFFEILFKRIFGGELEVCITNHYYFPDPE